MITEHVYNGTANVNRLRFEREIDGAPNKPIKMDTVTRVVLELYGETDQVIDSDAAGDAITWTKSSDKIEFQLGDQGVPAGKYRARLEVYDSSRVEPQLLAHETDERLQFVFWD